MTDTTSKQEMSDQDRVKKLEERVRELESELDNGREEVSRREFGKAGLLAALGLGSAAGAGGQQVLGEFVGVGRAQSGGGSISNIGELSGPIAGGDTVSNLVGDNLSLDSNGNLNASGGGSSIFSDSDGDGVYEQTTGDGIDVPSVRTGQQNHTHFVATSDDFGAAMSGLSEGDELVLLPGSHDITAGHTIDTPNVTVRGPGVLNLTADIDSGTILRAAAEGVEFRNISVSGNQNARIGVRFDPCDNGRAETVTVSGIEHSGAAAGVRIGNSDNVDVIDCEVENVNNTSSNPARGIQSDASATEVTVRDCDVRNITSGNDADGIRINSPDSTVDNNDIENCDKRAVKLDGSGTDSTVTNNRCYWDTGGPTTAAIDGQTTGAEISGNYLSAESFNNTGIGTASQAADVSISGGTVEIRDGDADGNTADDAIGVAGTNISVDGVTVKMNGGGRYGVSVRESAQGVSIGSVKLVGSGDSGIRLWGPDGPTGVSVSGATIIGAGNHGVEVTAGTRVSVTGSNIDATNNAIDDSNAVASTAGNAT